MRTTTLLAAVAAGLLATGVLAAAPAVVEAVQYPAWLERGGRAVPLTPGTTLRSDDKLRTGGNARVRIKLPEGSAVKLGENAEFQIVRVEDGNVFKAALRVLTGAFRFTTPATKKKAARDVSIRVKNVTVGIRGTDVWGKSTEERDLVCLLEGRVSVGAEGHPPVTLDTPLDYYEKPRDGAPGVARVDAKKLEEWSAETEIPAGGAAARAGGRWMVVAGSFPRRDGALALQRALRAGGYPAEVAAAGGAFEVRVAGLAGESEARALASGIGGVHGVSAPAVREGAGR